MIYDLDYINEHFYDIIVNDNIIKTSMTSKHIPVYYNDKIVYVERKVDDVFIIDYEYFINNSDFLINKYKNITFKHLRKIDVDCLKKCGFKLKNVSKYQDVIKYIDDDFLKLSGKKYRVERWNKNHYDKMNFVVTDNYRNLDELLKFIDYWTKKKRETGTMIAVSGHDKNLFSNLYCDYINNKNILKLFFYHNDEIIGFQFMEKVYDDFWILHTRKTDRYRYSNLNLYVDLYTFDKIYKETNKPFYVKMGQELGKVTDYKLNRFPNHLVFYYYTCKLDNTKEVVSLF